MAVKVIVPNKNYNSKFEGVPFINGEGIFEDEELGRMLAKDLGYEIEEMSAPKKKAPAKRKSTKKVAE